MGRAESGCIVRFICILKNLKSLALCLTHTTERENLGEPAPATMTTTMLLFRLSKWLENLQRGPSSMRRAPETIMVDSIVVARNWRNVLNARTVSATVTASCSRRGRPKKRRRNNEGSRALQHVSHCKVGRTEMLSTVLHNATGKCVLSVADVRGIAVVECQVDFC